MPTNANRPVRRRKVVAHYSDSNPSTFAKKRQSKSPGQDSLTPPPTTTTTTTTATPSHHPQDPPIASSRKRKAVKAQATSQTPPPPPPKDDVAMAHPIIIHPVFPLKELVGGRTTTTTTSTAAMLLQSNTITTQHHHHPSLLGNGQIPVQPPPPVWRPVRGSHVKEYDPPAIGTITWLSVRFDDPSYAVVGDCRGAVGLLNDDHRTIKVIRTTSAAVREAAREIKRRKVMAYPNAIVQCVWSHGTIVVLTKTEVECLSVDSGDSLWTIPVVVGDYQKKTSQQSPLFSLQHQGLLWTTTGQWGPASSTTASEMTTMTPPGSLLLWDNVHEKGNNKPTMLSLLADASTDTSADVPTTIAPRITTVPNFRCLAALWERRRTTTTMSSPSSFFCVGQQTRTDNETIELMRGHVSKAATTRIIVEARQGLPNNGRILLNECTLQQFDNQYLFVAGRGIRMYQASDLSFIATYGESVQVHGKTVYWSRCCWLPIPNIRDGEIRISRKKCWIERADALSVDREGGVQQRDDDNNKNYWLMGLPHPFKGPEELRSNLYVWPQGQDGASSIYFKAPTKGCLSDVWVKNRRPGGSTGWSAMVVSAANGELQQLCDSVKTNFAGVMYPVGFNITPDNIEYIENEDELDVVMANFEKPMLGLYDEDPVIAADDGPQVKDPRPQAPLFIDVLADDNDREDEHPVICWPEIREFNIDHVDSPGSPKRGDRRFHGLPQLEEVKQVMAEAKEEETDVKTKSVPGKRRATNLEAIKQSSIDPRLRSVMEQRRFQWQDSAGSALDPSELKHSLEEKSLAMELLYLVPGQKRRHLEAEESDYLDGSKDELSCSACLGRMTLHTCGKREGPIDYDAIAREEHAQRERKEAEKIRVKKERQKLAELKRKENKKKKKLEDERRLREQQQAESDALTNATRKQSDSCSKMDIVYTDYSHHHQSPSFHSRDFFAYPPTLRIDGNEVVPSTSLDPTDALSALAGLADSLSNHATPDLSSTNWNLGHHVGNEGRHGFGEGSNSAENYFGSASRVRTIPSPLFLPASKNSPPPMSTLDNGTTIGLGNHFVSSASTALPGDGSDDVVTNEAECIMESDITFYTAPGSIVPIMASPANGFTAKEEYCHDDDAEEQGGPSLQVEASSFLSPTGISAIAMLSETAARQAIVEGTENGLMSPTDHLLVEPRNGSKEILDVNCAPSQCAESRSNGLRLDSVPSGAKG